VFLIEEKMTQADLARELGVARQAVQGWCSGGTRPGLMHALALESYAEIGAEQWLSPLESLALRGLRDKAKKEVDASDEQE
jgi:transcriptional regulator with XRE-family HTH domain